jgi:regulator of protease activity HflC (stomatin/prohibitin superfamily)
MLALISISSIGNLVGWGVLVIFILAFISSGIKTIPQAHVAVITLFGKYRRILTPGLNFLIPFLEKVYRLIPVQNRTEKLEFAAITMDQASVHFETTIIYTVKNSTPEIIQLVAFKFVDEASFDTALNSAVEASIREFVATKKQADILGLRAEIVEHAQAALSEELASWGMELVNLNVNDISFDAAVTESMNSVVTALNSQKAAEYNGQAILITRTKAAEAEGAYVRILAENNAKAAELQGEGLAAFRKAITAGLEESTKALVEANIDPAIIQFAMWTETLKEVAAQGKGNTIFFDGSVDGMDHTMKRIQSVLTPKVSGGDNTAAAKVAQGSAHDIRVSDPLKPTGN